MSLIPNLPKRNFSRELERGGKSTPRARSVAKYVMAYSLVDTLAAVYNIAEGQFYLGGVGFIPFFAALWAYRGYLRDCRRLSMITAFIGAGTIALSLVVLAIAPYDLILLSAQLYPRHFVGICVEAVLSSAIYLSATAMLWVDDPLPFGKFSTSLVKRWLPIVVVAIGFTALGATMHGLNTGEIGIEARARVKEEFGAGFDFFMVNYEAPYRRRDPTLRDSQLGKSFYVFPDINSTTGGGNLIQGYAFSSTQIIPVSMVFE